MLLLVIFRHIRSINGRLWFTMFSINNHKQTSLYSLVVGKAFWRDTSLFSVVMFFLSFSWLKEAELKAVQPHSKSQLEAYSETSWDLKLLQQQKSNWSSDLSAQLFRGSCGCGVGGGVKKHLWYFNTSGAAPLEVGMKKGHCTKQKNKSLGSVLYIDAHLWLSL